MTAVSHGAARNPSDGCVPARDAAAGATSSRTPDRTSGHEAACRQRRLMPATCLTLVSSNGQLTGASPTVEPQRRLCAVKRAYSGVSAIPGRDPSLTLRDVNPSPECCRSDQLMHFLRRGQDILSGAIVTRWPSAPHHQPSPASASLATQRPPNQKPIAPEIWLQPDSQPAPALVENECQASRSLPSAAT